MTTPTLTDILSRDQIEFIWQLLDNEQIRVPVKSAKVPSQVYDIFERARKQLTAQDT